MSDPVETRAISNFIPSQCENDISVNEFVTPSEEVCQWVGDEPVSEFSYVEAEGTYSRMTCLVAVLINRFWCGEGVRKSATEALTKALKDTDREVCRQAAWAAINGGGRVSVPALIDALGDNKEHVRINALWALGKIGSKAKGTGAVPALVEALKDNSRMVRFEAACALIEVDPGKANSTSTFRKVLRDFDNYSKSEVIEKT